MQWLFANHDPALVLLSYVVSVVGAFVALYTAEYITDARGRIRPGWLILASVVLGGCAIWAMHFTGMLAYRMSAPATYDIGATVASLVLPIALSAVGFLIAYRFKDSVPAWLIAGAAFGGGVAAMHYLGMAALRTPMQMSHDSGLVAISVVIAVVAATAALRIVVHWQGLKRLFSPLLMGLAVCGMHYTGMAAMSMSPGAADVEYFQGAWSASFMGFTAGLFVFLTLMVGAALVTFRKVLDIDADIALAQA